MYYVQESDDGEDVAFIAGPSDVPRATRLSSANILSAVGASAGEKGNIQSIAAGPGGEIYFYFLGGGKRNTVACLGKFLPRNTSIQILASSSELQSATNMGPSIELARGTVVCSAGHGWLLVRHTDTAAMFRFEPRDITSDGSFKLPAPIRELRS